MLDRLKTKDSEVPERPAGVSGISQPERWEKESHALERNVFQTDHSEFLQETEKRPVVQHAQALGSVQSSGVEHTHIP